MQEQGKEREYEPEDQQHACCSLVVRQTRPRLGGDTQHVLDTDWRLRMCVRATGKEFQLDWGPEAFMRAAMARELERGRDVWLVAPDGTKHLPIE
jgi:hypothetical protein